MTATPDLISALQTPIADALREAGQDGLAELAVEAAERLAFTYEWVAVADRLPTEDGAYMVFAESADPDKPLITNAWFTPGIGWLNLMNYWREAVTHWTTMPKRPNVKSKPKRRRKATAR